jgi:electron transfer flavoprotein alpha subunit
LVCQNSYGLVENASTLTEEDFDPSIGESDFGVKVESVEKLKVAIADAEIVVSAGRGLKVLKNWAWLKS